MIEITVNPNSFAITCLYQKVIERASKSSSLKDVPHENYINSVSEILGENLRIDAARVNSIESVQFKPGDEVPLDFYIHLRLADTRVASLVSKTLMNKLANEGYIPA